MKLTDQKEAHLFTTMKPNKIFLIRHGQSHGNVNRAIHNVVPDWKIPLTDVGHDQAKIAGDLIAKETGRGVDPVLARLGVYLSPYVRTRETWQGIKSNPFLAKNLVFEKEDPRLREQEWGNLRGFDKRGWEEIENERDEYGSFFYRFMHGESGADVWDRMSDFLSTLYRDFENPDFPKNILIVTHGYALRVLLMRWFHMTVEEFHCLANPKNAQFYELNLGENDKYSLVTPLKKYPSPTNFTERELV